MAGVFGLEDGLALVAARGRLMQMLPDEGEMASIFAEESRVREAIEPHARTVSIAAINGPTSIAISGDRAAVRSIVEEFERQGVRVKPMLASRAFHSPLMDPILESFGEVARGVPFAAWLFRIAANAIADRWQRISKERSGPVPTISIGPVGKRSNAAPCCFS